MGLAGYRGCNPVACWCCEGKFTGSIAEDVREMNQRN